jgi:threonine aldolase
MSDVIRSGRQFASDNYAGVCPEAWDAMEEARHGHVSAYGEDEWTAKASDRIREIFEIDCEVFFAFNGTAANSLSLASLCRSYHSVLCHEHAHVERDECGAPEFFSNGTKVLLLPGENGKIQPEAIENEALRRTDVHYPKPRAVSITQSTELGTVYSVDELRAIHEMTRKHGLHVHMDGARFANAVAALGAAPKEITWKVGVDVLCFGGTKNGTPVGDAVVFFNKELAREFDYRCKQAGQLASKMRFLSAPWVGLLRDDVWLGYGGHANAMAALMESELARLCGVTPMFPRQANAVFVQLPQSAIDAMHALGWKFYTFIGEGGCRLMCSWDITEDDVRGFAADLAAVMGKSG